MWAQIRECTIGKKSPLWSPGFNWSMFAIMLTFVALLSLKPFDFQIPEKDFCHWGISIGFPGSDKVGHFIAFFVLGLLLYRGLTLNVPQMRNRALVVTIGTLLCLGILIEVAQPFMGRSCDIADLVADTLGGVLGMLSWEAFRCSVDRIATPNCWLRHLI